MVENCDVTPSYPTYPELINDGRFDELIDFTGLDILDCLRRIEWLLRVLQLKFNHLNGFVIQINNQGNINENPAPNYPLTGILNDDLKGKTLEEGLTIIGNAKNREVSFLNTIFTYCDCEGG